MKVELEVLHTLVACIQNDMVEAVEMDVEKIEPAADGVNQYRLVVVYREFQPEKFGLNLKNENEEN